MQLQNLGLRLEFPALEAEEDSHHPPGEPLFSPPSLQPVGCLVSAAALASLPFPPSLHISGRQCVFFPILLGFTQQPINKYLLNE